MSIRTERVGNLIRNTVGQLILAKLSDPRIDSARTSITRVEVADDLASAKVYVSVIGSEAQQQLTVKALRHAAGHIQELMMKEIQLRFTPTLDFQFDKKFKKTLATLGAIQKASEELRLKDEARARQAEKQAQEKNE